MEELDKLVAWLAGYPGWGGSLQVDHMDGLPGSIGLFPAGLEEVGRSEDVLGNVTVHNRSHYMLHRVCAGPEDSEENARWLLEFQRWALDQTLYRKTPVFGDLPERERILAQRGRLFRNPQTGTATYGVNVTVDWMRKVNVDSCE